MQKKGSSPSLLNTISDICCACGVTRLFEGTQGTRWVTFLHFQLTPTPRRMTADPWTEETLTRALQLLADWYHPLTIEEATGYFHSKREVPESSVVLTTSLTRAPAGINLPKILNRCEVPMAVYLSPGLLERGTIPWPLTIRWGLEKTQKSTLDLLGRRWLLNSPQKRQETWRGVVEHLYRMPGTDRQGLAEAVVEELGLDLMDIPGLTWNEAVELAKCDYVTLGATGYTGDSLIRLPLDRVVYELSEARYAFEDRLGIPLQYMEYPWGDASSLITSEFRAHGCRSGIALYEKMRGMNPPDTSPLELTARTLHTGGVNLMRTDLAGLLDFLPFIKDTRGQNDDVEVSTPQHAIPVQYCSRA